MGRLIQVERFQKLYLRALNLDAVPAYAKMEAKVVQALDDLEEELNKKDRELNFLIEKERETGRCGTCGNPLLECDCELWYRP